MRSCRRHEGMTDFEIDRLIELERSAFQQIKLAAALPFASSAQQCAIAVARGLRDEAVLMRAVVDTERAANRSKARDVIILRVIRSAKHGVI